MTLLCFDRLGVEGDFKVLFKKRYLDLIQTLVIKAETALDLFCNFVVLKE